MMRPRDPRVRQTINQISYNLESANESAQERIYTFSHNYILPCFTSIGNCVSSCTAPCLSTHEDHRRRHRRRYPDFDFYDDWENEEADDTILGWGTDELDRLLAGSGLARGGSDQPRRQRRMSYGARRASRRKSGLLIPDERDDPTVIPSSSFLGFLERFPWRFGARGLKYRPSAADLQEHPTGLREVHEQDPLIEESEETGEGPVDGNNGRYRSATQSSRETANSLSSRGDLIMSDEEEDAVPLDDEFAMALARRGTGLESDDQEGSKPDSMRSISGTFSIAPTTSSKSSKNKKKKKKRSSRIRSPPSSFVDLSRDMASISIDDLKREDEQAAREEELEIVQKRLAARQLALHRGIGIKDVKTASISPSQTAPSGIAHSASPVNTSYVQGKQDSSFNNTVARQDSNSRLSESDSRTEPFPPLPDTPMSPESIEQISTHSDPSRNSDVRLKPVEPVPEPEDDAPSSKTDNDRN